MHRLASITCMLAISFVSFASEKHLAIPTDAKAKYTILEIGGKWPDRTIVTKRVGSSGTSYSERIYNCSNNTVKYLGNGDTLTDMRRSNPDPKMAPIVQRSIADYVGRQACKR